MIDEDAYDFVLTYRASNGEYEGSPFPNVREFKLWVMGRTAGKQGLIGAGTAMPV